MDKTVPNMAPNYSINLQPKSIVVASMLVLGIKGLDFSIEFVGGSSITFTDTGDVTLEQMRDPRAKELYGKCAREYASSPYAAQARGKM